jgi:thiol-disulfide isomerase/thioredoxin
MQHFDSPNVVYLEASEFTPDGKLHSSRTPPYRNTPYFSGDTLVLVQGTYCGYCNELKPVFQKLAEEYQGRLDFATIEIDGKRPGEKIFQTDQLSRLLGKPLEGVPMILRYRKGRLLDQYRGNRSFESLREFIFS